MHPQRFVGLYSMGLRVEAFVLELTWSLSLVSQLAKKGGVFQLWFGLELPWTI